MCKGQCPGTSIDHDWRNRTEHCDLWKQLFRDIEDSLLNRGESPLSVHPQRKEVERIYLEGLMSQPQFSMKYAVQEFNNRHQPAAQSGQQQSVGADGHGDHYDDGSGATRESTRG